MARNPTGKGGFVKGRSGNPKGRPKDADLADARSLAKAKTKDAMDALVKIATKGKSESARVAAATALLDRGWGKPSQPLDGDGQGGAVKVMVVTGVDRDDD